MFLVQHICFWDGFEVPFPSLTFDHFLSCVLVSPNRQWPGPVRAFFYDICVFSVQAQTKTFETLNNNRLIGVTCCMNASRSIITGFAIVADAFVSTVVVIVAKPGLLVGGLFNISNCTCPSSMPLLSSRCCMSPAPIALSSQLFIDVATSGSATDAALVFLASGAASGNCCVRQFIFGRPRRFGCCCSSCFIFPVTEFFPLKIAPTVKEGSICAWSAFLWNQRVYTN